MSSSSDAQPFALIVDDDPIIVEGACQILEDAGFRSLSAEDFASAMDTLEKYRDAIVLLFTDIKIAGPKNGVDLAWATKRRWPQIGILVASGSYALKNGDLPDGAIFVRKPFSADIVYERLQIVLPHGRKPEPLKKMMSRLGGADYR
jgi:DNA-binding response OmpR family regulator